MELATYIDPNPKHAGIQAKLAEDLGFTTAWFGDLPMGFADVYACMTLAAVNTTKIRLGTSIAAAPWRHPLTTASAIATINTIAPGRTILGFGSGAFGRALTGLPPLKIRELRNQLQVIRGLLGDGEAMHETDGKRVKVRFLNRELGSVNIDDPIPIYVAASAPQVAALAGEFADGVITGGKFGELISFLLGQVREAARSAGRTANAFPCMSEIAVFVLRPGETLESSVVIESLGGYVLVILKMFADGLLPEQFLPDDLKSICEAYRQFLLRKAPTPEERHLAIWEGCFTLSPDERRFVTPELLKWAAIIGTREEVIDEIKALEKSGVTQIAVAGAIVSKGAAAEQYFVRVAKELIGRV